MSYASCSSSSSSAKAGNVGWRTTAAATDAADLQSHERRELIVSLLVDVDDDHDHAMMVGKLDDETIAMGMRIGSSFIVVIIVFPY